MKKLFTIILVLFITMAVANDLSAQTFSKGTKVAQIGLGFGFAGVYGDAGIPPITLGFQYGLEEKISVGPVLGFTTSSQEFFGGKWSYSYVVIGARGEYHFLENSEKMDAYGGVTLGYAIVSSSITDENPYYNQYYSNVSASSSYAVYGFHVGGKYYVTPQISLFGELGYGIGYITVGAAYRL
ncbi:MAG: hypothetical protein ACM3RX_10285 [Methanococcaceae archaeon]